VSEPPLEKPDHLRDVPASQGEWVHQHLGGLAALVVGIVSFVVVAIVQDPLWSTPDWRLSAPGFAAAVVATFVSLRRRERAHFLWLLGLGFAGAALVLGWFLLLAIVIGATAILMLILNSVM
jgi:hypothetical protein